MNLERLQELLTRHEGKRRYPYDDADGRQIQGQKRVIHGKVSIGIGRNLTDKGLSDEEVQYLFRNDVAEAVLGARRLFPNFALLSENRQLVVISMVFNLGVAGFGSWTNTCCAIREGRFQDAARHMMDSLWYSQLGGDPPGTDDGKKERSEELIEMMRKG